MKISAYKDNRSKTSILSKAGIFSASLLAVSSVVYLYSPVSGTHADSSADVNVSVRDVMTLTIDKSSLDFELLPYHYDTGDITLTASTNSPYGYTLTLEDDDSIVSLLHNSGASSIPSIFNAPSTLDDMLAGAWGYSLNGTDFYMVPRKGLPVALKKTDTPMVAASEDTSVTIGVKLGGEHAAGIYSDSIVFTMYTNGQDGDTDLSTADHPVEYPVGPGETPRNPCQGKAGVELVGNTYVMTDPRDGNEYTVAAQNDGHCWMTQNLRIINKTISSADSNLPENETFTIPASSLEGFAENNTNNAYLDDTYGGYYTFYTATAGWGTGEVESGNSPKDICPKGWMISSGGPSGEYRYLTGTASAVQSSGPMLTRGGRIVSGTMSNQGSLGFYWTSTVNTAAYAYDAGISSSKWSNSTASIFKYNGAQIRCRAK